jgi:acyl-CoA synthetase (AMP-forming)/AMP-acid ligase II
VGRGERMSGWNFADVWGEIAARYPDELALVYGDERRTWSEFAGRAAALGTWLIEHGGLRRGDKVAQYLYNQPEYLESLYASFWAGLVPVNTNYRYTGDELTYLWNDADVAAVVFDGTFAAICDELRPVLPMIRAWVWVDPGDTSTCPEWATPYAETLTTPSAAEAYPRSGDDLYLLYTGGTTGMPKGVMWRQDDLFAMLEQTAGAALPEPPDAARFVDSFTRKAPLVLAAAPLMHGTAAFFSFSALNRAGGVVTMPARRFDAENLLDVVVATRSAGICIVGDAFARPLVAALDAEPERWDLDRVRVWFSSGAMLSAEIKQALLRHAPRAVVIDSLGSSESGMIGRSVTGANDAAGTARFFVGPDTRVIDEQGNDVEPGSGVSGRLAVHGRIPLGYYRDEAKTASTFVELNGKRYVVAGDWAEVAADGAITLLGRGSGCINTAGEKVFPEEVEEVLKRFPGVADAAVVGVPDERFGQRVVALVELGPAAVVHEAGLIEHTRQSLAGYKVPRQVFFPGTLGRAPNGKLDLRRLRDEAMRLTGERGDAQPTGAASSAG